MNHRHEPRYESQNNKYLEDDTLYAKQDILRTIIDFTNDYEKERALELLNFIKDSIHKGTLKKDYNDIDNQLWNTNNDKL